MLSPNTRRPLVELVRPTHSYSHGTHISAWFLTYLSFLISDWSLSLESSRRDTSARNQGGPSGVWTSSWGGYRECYEASKVDWNWQEAGEGTYEAGACCHCVTVPRAKTHPWYLLLIILGSLFYIWMQLVLNTIAPRSLCIDVNQGIEWPVRHCIGIRWTSWSH